MTFDLRGTHTALVTPFDSSGAVDLGALAATLEFQLSEGIDGLVPCGTTGEAVTMSAEEKLSVIAAAVKAAAGKIPVSAGTGGNDTARTVEFHKKVAGAGANYALVVTPYYNKPSTDGLRRHFNTIADSSEIPVILYNVPGRTGCDMAPSLVAELSRHERIVAIKEAVPDLDRVVVLRRECVKDFVLLSGDDPTAAPFVALGGDGLISVTSNIAPAAMAGCVRAALDGDMVAMRKFHSELRDVFVALFLESNPIPIKAALAMKGLLSENYRLPLCPMESGTRAELARVLRVAGLID